MDTSVLQIKGLKKQIQTFTLGPIDLEVEKGTVVAIVGDNGSGKSTFFRLVMQLIQSDEGQIEFSGQRMDEQEVSIKQNTGYVGDLLDPYGHLTISELAELISYWYSSWDHEYFKKLMQRYQMDGSKKFGKVSKGTKKKVEFIFALSHDSRLLLLDEPTAGVDISSQKKMKEDLLLYMENGERSIVFATHNIDEINQLSDYIVILKEGKVIHSLNKDEIYENWARVWVSEVTEKLKEHPNVLSTQSIPPQIVTNNLHELKQTLHQENITISHTQRLNLEEVLEHAGAGADRDGSYQHTETLI